MRRSVRGPLRAGLLAVLLGVASACSDGPVAAPVDGPPGGCGDCEQETAEIRERVERVPGVAEVRRLRYSSEDVNDGTHLVVQLVVAGSPPQDPDEVADAVADAVARIGWESPIRELENVNVLPIRSDGALLPSRHYAFVGEENLDRYAGLWGPRPSGSSASTS